MPSRAPLTLAVALLAAGTEPALRDRFCSEPAGTRLRLSVESGGERREVALVLADLV